MHIAIIGTGNVGGTLARKWAENGHSIHLGVQNKENFKGKDLEGIPGISVHSVAEAVAMSEVVVLATPAMAAVEVTQSLGPTEGKVLIDTMNIVMGRGPAGFTNTTDAILAHTETKDVVKCFNTTGFNNMADPRYGDRALDLFVAGNSPKAKALATQLALDAGFGQCYDVGGNDRFFLMEQFAFFWINLAMMQGQGRDIGFALLKR